MTGLMPTNCRQTTQQRVLILGGDFAEDGPRPQVLLAYEDLDMALRAMDVLAVITREVGENVEVQFSMWRFDSFDSPKFREMAARQAKQADFIVVAPRSIDDLPPQIQSWLKQWPRRREPSLGALVAVFAPTTGQDPGLSDVGRQLRAAAELTGLDFFCGALARTEAVSAGEEEAQAAQREPANFQINETHGLQIRTSRWGIKK